MVSNRYTVDGTECAEVPPFNSSLAHSVSQSAVTVTTRVHSSLETFVDEV